MPMYLGKNWDDVTKELIRRACAEELLPETAEYQLRQFMEDGIVVIAYQRGPSNRSGRGGSTSFHELRITEEGLQVKLLTNLGPLNAATA